MYKIVPICAVDCFCTVLIHMQSTSAYSYALYVQVHLPIYSRVNIRTYVQYKYLYYVQYTCSCTYAYSRGLVRTVQVHIHIYSKVSMNTYVQ